MWGAKPPTYLLFFMEHLLQTIKHLREIVNDLEKKHDRKFTLDGHLFGSIGEVYASKKYNLTLLKQSHEGHDAQDEQKNFVQIKVTQMKSVGIRKKPDKLLVLQFNADKNDFEEIYFGDGHEPWEISNKPTSSGQRFITLNKLRQLVDGKKSSR